MHVGHQAYCLLQSLLEPWVQRHGESFLWIKMNIADMIQEVHSMVKASNKLTVELEIV
jgi:hypothetical protein